MPNPVKAVAEPAGGLAAPQQPASGNAYLLGCLAALAVVFIWSSWLVASRSGALSGLTVYDLAALRYGISGLVALPFVLYFKPWKTLSIGQMAVLTVLLGPVYILLVFNGFVFAPAAHGGIFMNGVLPVMTLAIGWLWLREAPRWQQLIAAAIILLSTILVVADQSKIAVAGSWRGDLLFLAAAVFFSVYMILGRLWRISTTQVLLCSSVLNAIIYLPLWYLFLPSSFADASQNQIIIQSFYQGFVPTLLGILLLTAAVRQIGSSMAAAFMAAVPGMGALLSLMFLGEVLGALSWVALGLLTAGIAMMAVWR